MFEASVGCVVTAAKTNVTLVRVVGFYIHDCSSLIVWSPAFLFALWSLSAYVCSQCCLWTHWTLVRVHEYSKSQTIIVHQFESSLDSITPVFSDKVTTDACECCLIIGSCSHCPVRLVSFVPKESLPKCFCSIQWNICHTAKPFPSIQAVLLSLPIFQK